MPGSVDLNLLIPLAALLEHRSVTAAARSLQMGQPAVSAALARLRRLYSDELLVRVGQRYELTPLAESLRDSVGTALELATHALSTAPGTDPSAAQRSFSVGVTDYDLSVLGGAILNLVQLRAPHVKVRFENISTEHLSDLPNRLRHLDCIIAQTEWLPGYPHTRLFSDRICCAVSADNDAIPDPVTVADLADTRWGAVTDSTTMLAVGRRMTGLPMETDRVVAVIDSMLGVLSVIAGTELVTLLPRRMVDRLGAAMGVRGVEIKDSELIAVDLIWHPARERDLGLTWFRGLVVQAAAGLASQAPDSSAWNRSA